MFTEIKENKKYFLNLLLLADEQDDMIARYLNHGRLFVYYESDTAICVAVLTDEGNGLCELKNIAVDPAYQRHGYGSRMLRFLEKEMSASFNYMQVGTGESPLTIPFYEVNGFAYSHRIENFFTDNYDHPIWEAGVLLKDMVYLKKSL